MIPISRSSSPLRQRFRPLGWLAVSYLVIGAITRVVLFFMAGEGVPLNPLYWLYAFGVGALYDLVTFLYIAWPLMLFLWLMPVRAYASRVGQWLLYALALALLFGLLFVAASEFTFWNEFGVRFNFIAVDYLVYTTEVIGNITESYPIGLWLSLLALLAVAVVFFTRRALRTQDTGSRFGRRSLVALAWLVLTVLSVLGIKGTMKEQTGNNYVNEIAGNGVYQFVAAFRAARLDYAKFYRTLPLDEAFAKVRAGLQEPNATFVSDDPHDIARVIRHAGPEKHLNVVLITVESLTADFIKAFGSSHGDITPNLDALAGQSLFFDRVYANGTRTVRGLEATSLSVPPTPGDSLVRAHKNENLFTIASIFNDRGYVSDFVYGGYGYFDNMNYFFNHNGYTAVDRRDIPSTATIHSENVWGVADEDLYTLALTQMDKANAQGKPFFLHIMTTSNHRPFTFPKGRVSVKNGTREGAIAYTDWAIGDFIKRAKAKPYFANTVFVITADHNASSAGRAALPVKRYHIPLWIYAPAQFKPQRIERFMGQLDIPPTLLGLLNFSYRTRFFGLDVLHLEPGRGRAFPSTYEKLGYLQPGKLSILEPQKKVEQVVPNLDTGDTTPYQPIDQNQIDQATADYQVAAYLFKHGLMAHRPEDSAPVQPLPAAGTSSPAPAASASSATH